MISFYSEKHGIVDERCVAEINKQLITEKERNELVEIYRQGARVESKTRLALGPKRMPPDQTMLRIIPREIPLFDGENAIPDLSRGEQQLHYVLLKQHNVSILKQTRLRSAFIHTPPNWSTRAHCEKRSPVLNIPLLDNGAEVLFFDDEQRVIDRHKFRNLGEGVIFNTSRWHIVYNNTDYERLVLSINFRDYSDYRFPEQVNKIKGSLQ